MEIYSKGAASTGASAVSSLTASVSVGPSSAAGASGASSVVSATSVTLKSEIILTRVSQFFSFHPP